MNLEVSLGRTRTAAALRLLGSALAFYGFVLILVVLGDNGAVTYASATLHLLQLLSFWSLAITAFVAAKFLDVATEIRDRLPEEAAPTASTPDPSAE